MNKRFPKARRWVLGLGVLTVLGWAGWSNAGKIVQQAAKPIPVTFVTVERGSLENTVTESGILELGDQQTLKSPEQGAVERVMVQVGDRVKSGQTLITLRDPERLTLLDTQRINWDKLQLDLKQTRQKIEDAKTDLIDKQVKLQEMQSLFEKGFISKDDLKSSQQEVRSATSALRESQVELQRKVLELREQELERRKLQEKLQDKVIVSPINAKVLEIAVKNGNGVEVGNPLLILGNPDRELVKLQLSGLSLSKVKVKQRVRVSGLGLKEKFWMGRVEKIAEFAGSDSQNSNNNSGQGSSGQVSATVVLDRPTGQLIPGMQVKVEVILEQRSQVLLLNTEAIQQLGAKPFVWLADAQQKAQKRSIQVGLEGLSQVEVKWGLKQGDRVIVPPPDTPLTSGTLVKEGSEESDAASLE